MSLINGVDHFEPSQDALSLRSDVVSSIKVFSSLIGGVVQVQGGVVAANSAELASKADTIITMLPSSPHVHEVEQTP